MNRLKEATYDGRKELFSYDKVGNRLSKTTNNITEKYVYNVKNQLKELHNENGITYFTHDKQGNTIKEETNAGSNIFEYNPLNQQIKAITKEGNTLVNRYDAEGLRYEIEEDEKLTRFIFHKDNILVETDKDYNTISRFTRGYEIVTADIADGSLEYDLGEDNNLNRYYYTVDEQGSTVFITDKDEGIRNSYHYDAFGNILDSNEEVHNRITYTGQQFDGITNQYYLRARFYNPVIGRFTQEDTYRGDGLNLYAYCANNPVEYWDPSGYSAQNSDTKIKCPRKGNTVNEGEGNPSTKISSEMEKKILEGQRKSPTKNEVIGGHSSIINNNNNIFAVEELSINPDGTKNIKFIKDLQDGNISKIKKSTVFPDSWNDSKIIDSIKKVGGSPTVSVRQRDGATWHRQIIDGVEIDVIKLSDDVISGYPTGKVNAPKPSGF